MIDDLKTGQFGMPDLLLLWGYFGLLGWLNVGSSCMHHTLHGHVISSLHTASGDGSYTAIYLRVELLGRQYANSCLMPRGGGGGLGGVAYKVLKDSGLGAMAPTAPNFLSHA